MRTLVFDTETTGLPEKGKALPSIVQIAAILYIDKRPVGHFSAFTIPLSDMASVIKMPENEFMKNAGLTQDVIDAVGLDTRTAMAAFNQLVRKSDRIVAHNLAFDNAVVMAAYKRVGAKLDIYKEVPKFCTMQTLTPIMKLPGKIKGKFKWPRLDEAYKAYVSPEGFEGAHDAMVDVTATAELLRAIEEKQIKLWRFE